MSDLFSFKGRNRHIKTGTAREPFVSHRLMGSSLAFTRAEKVLVIARGCVGGFHRLGGCR